MSYRASGIAGGRRRGAIAGLATVIAVGLAGCGGSDDGSATADTPTDRDPTASEVDTIAVANFRQNAAVPMFIAEREGLTEEYGVEYERQWIETSPAGMAALVGGEVDATFSSYPGVIDAARQGIPVRIVAEMFRAKEESMTVETLPDSGIEELADLEGKRVGVVGLNSSHDNRIKYAMLQEDLDPDSVEFIELPYGEMGAAIEQGTVDAGVLTGVPLQTTREAIGTVPMMDLGGGLFEEFPEGGWIMMADFVEQNPNAVAAFQCIQIRSHELMRDNPEMYDTIMQEELGFDEAALEVTPMLNQPTDLDPEGIQMVPDMMLEMGAIDEEFDVSEIVVPLPDNC